VEASELLIEALNMRWEYCAAAGHSFPSTCAQFVRLNQSESCASISADNERHRQQKCTVSGKYDTEGAIFVNSTLAFT